MSAIRSTERRISFPLIDLSNDEKTWLEAVYSRLLAGEKLNPAETRVRLWDNLSEDFEWQSIDTRLLRNGNEITLLGILHVDRDSEFVETIDRLITHIANLIKDDPTINEIASEKLSNELTIERGKIEISFELI